MLIAVALTQFHKPGSSLEHKLVREHLTFIDFIEYNSSVFAAIIRTQTWQVGAQALAVDNQSALVPKKT